MLRPLTGLDRGIALFGNPYGAAVALGVAAFQAALSPAHRAGFGVAPEGAGRIDPSGLAGHLSGLLAVVTGYGHAPAAHRTFFPVAVFETALGFKLAAAVIIYNIMETFFLHR
jgi:hypothetical protein